MNKIEFYKHNLSDLDKQEVLKVLDSVFLTTGSLVGEFEQKFVAYMGSKFAVGVMSCTHALELALRYYGIGEGDEVITTPMSFVATANVVEMVGAKPVFVDVEAETGNLNAELVEQFVTSKTKAIIPVHLYGQMCDMVKLRAIADKYGLKIIEDCAHCIEAMRENIRPGWLGDIACFSFYATKNLTCGEGGAITCNDENIYSWMLQARSHGINKNAMDRYTKKYEHYDMNFLGYKCNMTNISAAMMIHQIEKLENFWKRRDEIANAYSAFFVNNPNVKILKTVSNSKNAWHLYTILVSKESRDIFLEKLQENGIGVAVNYRPIHLMRYYRDKYRYKEGDFKNAENIGFSTVSLPLYPKLKNEEVEYICDKVNSFFHFENKLDLFCKSCSK